MKIYTPEEAEQVKSNIQKIKDESIRVKKSIKERLDELSYEDDLKSCEMNAHLNDKFNDIF